MLRPVISSLAVLLFCGQALAGSLRASLDRSVATGDDELTLTLTVVGDASQPVLPSSLRDDFDVSGTRQAHSVSYVNGRMSSNTQYSYNLTPKRLGTLTVPAITMKVDGAQLSTEPLTVTVQAASASQAMPTEVYARAEVAPLDPARTTAWVGEQIIYSLKLFARSDAECSSLTLPSFANANVLQLGQNRQYITHLGNEELTVVEIRRAVFPTKPGPLEIPAAVFTCTVQRNSGRSGGLGGIFGRAMRKTVRSNDTTIVVQALPEAPRDFSGLVGSVTADARLSVSDLRQGESTTLTVRVRGNADIARAKEPAARLSDTFKLYPDKPHLDSDDSGAELMGTRVFESALVAQRAGDFTVALDPIVYFDPQKRTFARAEIPALALHVAANGANTPGSASGAASPDPSAANPSATNRSGSRASGPVATERLAVPSAAQPSPFGSGASSDARGDVIVIPTSILWRVVWGLAAGVVVSAAAAGLWRFTKRRSRSTRAERRASARRALDALNDVRDNETPAQISRILRELIGSRVGSTGTALTTDEAIAALERTASPAAAHEARCILHDCDGALYAGATAVSAKALIGRARGFIERLNRDA